MAAAAGKKTLFTSVVFELIAWDLGEDHDGHALLGEGVWTAKNGGSSRRWLGEDRFSRCRDGGKCEDHQVL